jgi:poly(3-hydroxybutyrate) depolymerase
MLARQIIRRCLSRLPALWMLAFAGAAGGAPALEQVAAGVNIDPDQISVSGISSGGFMAHQFHVAHSEHIMGAGIIAGGPYYCAHGTILDAVTRCSQFVMLECSALGLDARWCRNSDLAPGNKTEIEHVARASFAEAKRQEAAGTISKLANLRNGKVYLFSGAHDQIVPLGVMDALFHFYADANKGGVAAENMAYRRTFPARHTMVRDGFDKPAGDVVGSCPLPPADPPAADKDAYIDDCEAVAKASALKNHCLCPPAAADAAGTPCPPRGKEAVCRDLADVDLAGAIFKRIYGEQALKAARVPVAESEVLAFDQRQVFGKFSDTPYNALQNASMAREGYVFIPKACKDGRPCKLHVAFHGCRQGGTTDGRIGHSGNLFAKFAGYNEWAQANQIIVLYPQIQARGGAFPLTPPLNPRGCWDWWGQNYTHTAYHTQRGTQIKAVAQMINILAGGKNLLEIPAE